MKTKTLFAGIAVLTFIGQSQLHAQATWTGAGTSGTPAAWSVSGNWTGTVPTNSSTIAGLTFSNTTNSFSNNDLTGLTITSISMLNTLPARDNTITGNKFTLSGDVTVSTGNWQAINTDIGLTGNRKFIVSSGQLTLGGALTDGTSAGGILKEGGATLVLKGSGSMAGVSTQSVAAGTPGAGTYLVPLVFNTATAGSVVLQNTAALGAASLKGIQFNSGGGGTLDLQTDTSVNGYGIFAGSGGTANTIIANRLTSVVDTNITHNLGVVQLGSSILTINKGSNVTGTGIAKVTFSAVSLTAGNNDRVVTLNGTAAISLGDVATTANAANNRRLGLAGTHANNAVTGVISNLAAGVSGTSVLSLIKSDASTWTLTGANTYTGVTTIAGGTLQLGNGGATGSLNSASAIQNGGTLAINRSGTITQGTDFAASIGSYTTDYSSNAAGVALGSPVLGKLVKSGSGNLILNGSNTLNATDSLTFSANGSGTVTLKNTAALGSAGNSVRFSGGGSGVLDLQTDTSVNAYHIASGTFNGGTIIANRANSGTTVSHTLGNLDLSSVTMTINKGGNVTGTAAVSFAELKMTGGNDNNPVTLAGSADITIGSASVTNNGISKRLQLDGTSANNSVTGAISNTNNATAGAVVSLIKANSSTWTLQAENTYTGTTTIKGGTLKLNTSTSIGSSPTITVGDAGSTNAVLDVTTAGFTVGSTQTLGGIGKILATGKTVTASGTISAGNSVGTLTIDGGTLALDASSKFTFELGTSSDLISLLNLATLNLGSGTLGLNDFTFSDSGGFNEGIYNLISGASSYSGTLDSGNLTGTVLGKDGTLSMSGNNLILTVVPEPSAALLGSLGVLALLRRRRVG